jgi:hypothetical protein
MIQFEKRVRTDREAQRISTAFYRFLELHSHEAEAEGLMRYQVEGASHCLTISLWSQGAAEAFERHLAAFTVAPPEGLAPVRRRRYEDADGIGDGYAGHTA